jgi:hypothetical protein
MVRICPKNNFRFNVFSFPGHIGSNGVICVNNRGFTLWPAARDLLLSRLYTKIARRLPGFFTA